MYSQWQGSHTSIPISLFVSSPSAPLVNVGVPATVFLLLSLFVVDLISSSLQAGKEESVDVYQRGNLT